MATRTTAYVPQTKYINNADGKGWLVVKYNAGGTTPPLPQFLKVKTYKVENGREYFTIMEGKDGFRGKKASTPLLRNGRSRLLTFRPRLSPGRIRFDRKNDKLWYGTRGPVDAHTDIKPNSGDPLIPLGTHNLAIPHEPHPKARGYESYSIYALTWFRIGTTVVNDRFLHPGRGSWGCATVDELTEWTNIYTYLIKRRGAGSKSVGTIQVFEGP